MRSSRTEWSQPSIYDEDIIRNDGHKNGVSSTIEQRISEMYMKRKLILKLFRNMRVDGKMFFMMLK